MSVVLLMLIAIPFQSQPREPSRARGSSEGARAALRRATESLARQRPFIARDLEVLDRLKTAEKALVDPMQPTIAITKAYEEVDAAFRAGGEFELRDGLIVTRQALEDARRSPGSADFGRLRALLRDRALEPSRRQVAKNALALGIEMHEWLELQEAIAAHVKEVSAVAAESLRAAEQ